MLPACGIRFRQDGEVDADDGVDPRALARVQVLDAPIQAVAVGACEGRSTVRGSRGSQIIGPRHAIVRAEGTRYVQMSERFRHVGSLLEHIFELLQCSPDAGQ
jgi:hypothetical protein